MANIVVDSKALDTLSKEMILYPSVVKSAMARSVNSTVKKVKSYVVDDVAQEYNIKKTSVKKTISSVNANRNKLQGMVFITDKRLKMSHFGYKQPNRLKPVQVKIKKGGYVTSTSQPPLFVAQSKQGKKEVFKRTTGNSRYPIEWGMTVSIPQMVSNETVYNEIGQKASVYLADRFTNHDLPYMLQKHLSK